MANALHANKTGERTLHLCIPLAVGFVGFIIASATQNLGARFFALFVEAQSYAGYVIILSWLSVSYLFLCCVPNGAPLLTAFPLLLH